MASEVNPTGLRFQPARPRTHPYSRAVSEYHCPHAGYSGPDAHEAGTLNRWLLQRLREANRCSLSLLPQHLYLAAGNQTVTVLRYEALEADAGRLFAAYGLPLRFSATERENSRSHRNVPQLTAANLTDETRRAIHAHARHDFQLFGYDKDYGTNVGARCCDTCSFDGRV